MAHCTRYALLEKTAHGWQVDLRAVPCDPLAQVRMAALRCDPTEGMR